MKERLKLFYTKKAFRGMVEEKDSVIQELQEKINKKEYACLSDYMKYREENEKLKHKVKELQGSKGGLIARINILIKSIEEAEDKIKDLQSNRYLIKEVPKDKTKSKQIMQIKSGTKNSKIIKEVTSE